MRTNENTQQKRPRRSLRTTLQHAWLDTQRAHRAMHQLTPYDDYLFNHRSEY